jgi:hypothetical protein
MTRSKRVHVRARNIDANMLGISLYAQALLEAYE